MEGVEIFRKVVITDVDLTLELVLLFADNLEFREELCQSFDNHGLDMIVDLCCGAAYRFILFHVHIQVSLLDDFTSM